MTVRRVAKALSDISHHYITMPTRTEMRASADALLRRFGIPDAPLGHSSKQVRIWGGGKKRDPLPIRLRPYLVKKYYQNVFLSYKFKMGF
jgi:hypothetical protein